MLAVTALDGLGFSKVIAAGTYFLRKYRRVLDDLNVFPVRDGDTGSNLYRTVRAALRAAARVKGQPLGVVATAAADGALLGARGNSGVIFSQMLRGFAHAVRDHDHIGTYELAVAMKDGVEAARRALVRPVEGTMLSVASAAADEARDLAKGEQEFYRFGEAIVAAASAALERTPDQLPVLREAGVVDSGGAGLLYFLEGILRFLPSRQDRSTAFPRRATQPRAAAQAASVGANRFCTEFVLASTRSEPHVLQALLAPRGDSLLVAGAPPTLRVHIHTRDPQLVLSDAGAHGRIEKLEVDDMERRHEAIAARTAGAFGIVAIVPGEGVERIARELGADETLVAPAAAPGVAEIVEAIERCAADAVVVLPNDANLLSAARRAASLVRKRTLVVSTRDFPAGLAVLVACGARPRNGPVPAREELDAAAARVSSAEAPADRVADVAERLSLGEPGLLTLYYGKSQTERRARELAHGVRERLPHVQVEWLCGGQHASEYVVSFER
jgi:DAK2 domain fusion protein YloV